MEESAVRSISEALHDGARGWEPPEASETASAAVPQNPGSQESEQEQTVEVAELQRLREVAIDKVATTGHQLAELRSATARNSLDVGLTPQLEIEVAAAEASELRAVVAALRKERSHRGGLRRSWGHTVAVFSLLELNEGGWESGSWPSTIAIRCVATSQ